MLTISLTEVHAANPCGRGWDALTAGRQTLTPGLRILGADRFPVADVLNSNPLEDALWTMRLYPDVDWIPVFLVVLEMLAEYDPIPANRATYAEAYNFLNCRVNTGSGPACQQCNGAREKSINHNLLLLGTASANLVRTVVKATRDGSRPALLARRAFALYAFNRHRVFSSIGGHADIADVWLSMVSGESA